MSTGSASSSLPTVGGFVPPPYPFDRLGALRRLAALHDGGVVDVSIGTPCDPPPARVVEALASSGTERGYPPGSGSEAFRDSAAGWIDRRFGVRLAPTDVAACVGTKEMIATAPQWLRLRAPDRDTVLYPEVAYPTYEMGATLAGCRAVPVPMSPGRGIDLSRVDAGDARRALCLFVNSPGNPTGQLDDLAAAAEWGRANRVPVFSDECYTEFTWDDRPRTILESGADGVVAVHSLSKRSNLAGLRVGFIAGDQEIVRYLAEVRRHAGLMVPGPVQAAAIVALDDDSHVEVQRERYHARLCRLAEILLGCGIEAELPGGNFYLWVRAPEGLMPDSPDRAGAPGERADGGGGDEDPTGASPGWAFATWLARHGGLLASPGDLYGPSGTSHVRLAVVQPDDRLELVAKRLAGAAVRQPPA